MDAKLVVVGGKATALEYQLQLPTILGRSRHASLPVGHPLVSRQHCELFEQDGSLMVRDLGSLNGTYVDDNRVAVEPVVLHPGGLLTVGSITFKAVYGAQSEPGALDDDQLDFSQFEAGSAPQNAQTRQTIHAETLEELPEPGGEDELNPPAQASNKYTETLPMSDSRIGSGQRDDSFDLNWLEDDAETGDDASPEDTAEVAVPVAKPALPAKPAKPAAAAKPPLAAKPQPPSAQQPGANENETVPMGSAGAAGDDAAHPNAADEEDLDDFLNSLK